VFNCVLSRYMLSMLAPVVFQFGDADPVVALVVAVFGRWR